MFHNAQSLEFASELYEKELIADYFWQKEGTDQEVIFVQSHSGKIADLIDDPTDCNKEELEAPMISYSVCSGEEDLYCGDYDHIGMILDEDDKKEFLQLFG